MTDYRALKSICIVFLQGIGDFIMLTPSLKKIKAINPSIEITVVLRKELGLRRLAENLDFLDNVIEMSLKTHPRFYIPWVFWTYEYWVIRKKLKEALKGKAFDRTKVLYTQLLPTMAYIIFCPGRIKRHKADRFASELGITLTQEEKNSPLIVIPEETRKEARKALSGCCDVEGSTVIGIQRNTLDRTRFIDIQEVQRFIDRLNETHGGLFFLVFADPDSYRLEDEMDGKHLHAPNLRYSLELQASGDAVGLAALVESCDYIVSVDSAVFNIAGALSKSTVGVFNTYKVHSTARALERENILCIDKRNVRADDLLKKFNLLYNLSRRQ